MLSFQACFLDINLLQVALAASISQVGTICFDIYIINIHGSSRGRGIVSSAQQGFISTSRSVALYPDESEIYENHVCLVNSELSSLSHLIPLIGCYNVGIFITDRLRKGEIIRKISKLSNQYQLKGVFNYLEPSIVRELKS